LAESCWARELIWEGENADELELDCEEELDEDEEAELDCEEDDIMGGGYE
jgi:hypothetical protein